MEKTLSLHPATHGNQIILPEVPKLCEIRKARMLNMHLIRGMRFSWRYDLPKVNPYIGEVPEHFIPFNCALTSTDYDCGVHFFIDDYQFERIWNSPERYLDFLKKFKCVTSPDFSLYANMPFPLQIYNTYRNRLLTVWMQKNGVNVLPSVSWSDELSYRFSFEALPMYSTVAVSTTGAMASDNSRRLFRNGFIEMCRCLSPSNIIVFGKRLDPLVEELLHGRGGMYVFKQMQYGRTW